MLTAATRRGASGIIKRAASSPIKTRHLSGTLCKGLMGQRYASRVERWVAFQPVFPSSVSRSSTYPIGIRRNRKTRGDLVACGLPATGLPCLGLLPAQSVTAFDYQSTKLHAALFSLNRPTAREVRARSNAVKLKTATPVFFNNRENITVPVRTT